MIGGCVYRDSRGDVCAAPIANHKNKLCKDHAAKNKGITNSISVTAIGNMRPNRNHRKLDLEIFPMMKPPKKIPIKVIKPVTLLSVREIEGESYEVPNKDWRSTMCPDGALNCKYGITCAFAHSKKDIRLPGSVLPLRVYVPRIISTIEGKYHPNAEVPAADVIPEPCDICGEANRFADRRLKPCGYMMCHECLGTWRSESITKKVLGTTCPYCRIEKLDLQHHQLYGVILNKKHN
jgi:hypothetical protein